MSDKDLGKVCWSRSGPTDRDDIKVYLRTDEGEVAMTFSWEDLMMMNTMATHTIFDRLDPDRHRRAWQRFLSTMRGDRANHPSYSIGQDQTE